MRTIELRQKRATLIAEARAILDKAEGENRNLTTGDGGEQSQYDAKRAQATELNTRIEREESQLALEVANAQHVGGTIPANQQDNRTTVTDNRPKGTAFTNCVRAIGVGHGDLRRAAEFAENQLHDQDLARALSASNATAGGFAVPTILAEEFIEFLRPASVVRNAGARVLPMSNGNLTLPKITGGAVATWIGENTNVPATQQTMGQVKLFAKKLGALVPISNDLLRYANPQTDGVIRADLVKAVAQAEDLAFLRGDGTAFTPKGMRNWCISTNFFATQSTLDITHITSDLGNAIQYLLTANVPVTLETGVFFMSPRTFVYLKTLRNPTTGMYAFPEMQGKEPTILGYKVAYTSQIPINLTATPVGGSQLTYCSEWYFANMSDCVIGEAVNLLLDVSMEAAYVDSNSNTISAFAQDQTVIRLIEQNDFALRYDVSAAVATAVSY